MKARRHHNNNGYRQIRNGKTREQVAAMARRLGVVNPILRKARNDQRDPEHDV